MIKVAFICVRNSGRSQIAEALGKLFASDVFESCSAGLLENKAISPVVIALLKKLYSVDISQTQHSKMLPELPPVDMVITMGAGVNCPPIPCQFREDWGFDDPRGMDEKGLIALIKSIEGKVKELADRLR